jgi:N-acetylglucosaminyldiphosphoundecaprenol N-acetyl-beta-D-mannosaminyltransferase
MLFLLGIPIHNVTPEEALDWVEARARSGRAAQMVTSNLDFIMQAWRDPEMQRIHLDADLVVADGWPPVFFSRFFGPRLKGRVAGSDLVVRLGAFARDRGLSLYALGGREGVATQAMKILGERAPGLRVAGCSSPPLAGLLDMDHAAASAEVARADPDVLLVAFGAPKQDKWIRMNLHRLGRPVAMGIGASLDFIAGVQTRAPRWVQALGMEWFWRLCGQPRRLFKRYAGNLTFLTIILARLAFARLRPGGRRGGCPAPEPSSLDALDATLARFAPASLESLEAAARRRTLVLDLSGLTWLGSTELGALAQLSGAARAGGRRLVLCGVVPRLARLLRLVRLDRWVEIPESPSDRDRRLSELAAPEETRRTRWVRADGTLEVVLASEFEGAEAARVQSELGGQNLDAIRSFVIDGHRLRYIDSAGLLFLKAAGEGFRRAKGADVSLRAFPPKTLDVLRREGLGALAAASA